MTKPDQQGDAADDLDLQTTSGAHNVVLDTVVSGSVVQANVISGGIHYHLPRRQAPLPQQLPSNPAAFVGRTDELLALTEALQEAVDAADLMLISTLAGTGGIGKTWLAVRWAYEHRSEFPDGQLFVDLRGFSPAGTPLRAEDVVGTFLDALGVEPGCIPADSNGRTMLYRSLVANKRMLIVLDNAATDEQLEPLLPNSPTCTVLVTSRRTLTTLIARHGARHLPIPLLDEDEALALLARRLGRTRVIAERDAAQKLIRLCGHHPLALAIMASRAHSRPALALTEFAAELGEQGLDALDDGSPMASLPTVLSWSLLGLTDQRRAVFALLGIAPGPDISLPAAAHLTGLDERQIAKVLRELADASLIEWHPRRRYSMHDLIRAYAATTAELDLTEQTRTAAIRRMLDFNTYTACAANRVLDPHRTPIEPDTTASYADTCSLTDATNAMAWFDVEHAGLLASQRAATTHGWHNIVWQLAWALTTFYERKGHRRDQLAVWLAALDSTNCLPDLAARITAHRNLGHAYTHLGRHGEATILLHQALNLASSCEDRTHEAHIHRMLAWDWGRQRHNGQALVHANRALDLYRTLGQPTWEANASNMVAWYAAQLGDYDSAREHCRTALVLHRQHSNHDGEANASDTLGYIASRTDDHRLAIQHYRHALSLQRVLHDTYASANVLDRLGHSYSALLQYELARAAWREALELYRQQGRNAEAERTQSQLDSHQS